MKEKTREKIINTFRIIILSLIFSAAIGYSLAGWVPPPGPPPSGNTPPPINVGGATQVKSGTLMIDQWLVAGKARVLESTVAGDSGKVLVTKDYVDSAIIGACNKPTLGTKLYLGIVQNCNAGVVTTNPRHLNCATSYIGRLIVCN